MLLGQQSCLLKHTSSVARRVWAHTGHGPQAAVSGPPGGQLMVWGQAYVDTPVMEAVGTRKMLAEAHRFPALPSHAKNVVRTGVLSQLQASFLLNSRPLFCLDVKHVASGLVFVKVQGSLSCKPACVFKCMLTSMTSVGLFLPFHVAGHSLVNHYLGSSVRPSLHCATRLCDARWATSFRNSHVRHPLQKTTHAWRSCLVSTGDVCF